MNRFEPVWDQLWEQTNRQIYANIRKHMELDDVVYHQARREIVNGVKWRVREHTWSQLWEQVVIPRKTNNA